MFSDPKKYFSCKNVFCAGPQTQGFKIAVGSIKHTTLNWFAVLHQNLLTYKSHHISYGKLLMKFDFENEEACNSFRSSSSEKRERRKYTVYCNHVYEPGVSHPYYPKNVFSVLQISSAYTDQLTPNITDYLRFTKPPNFSITFDQPRYWSVQWYGQNRMFHAMTEIETNFLNSKQLKLTRSVF